MKIRKQFLKGNPLLVFGTMPAGNQSPGERSWSVATAMHAESHIMVKVLRPFGVKSQVCHSLLE